MNPIYKFELTAGNTTQRAFPIYKDDLEKDFEKESNQEFFRAKLSGKLTFESDDYTFIVSQAFETQFVLEIFISYNAGQSWTSYWRGTFWKTDCEFDGDAETVVVQPTVWDQYNDVLAGMDKEYNLIELAPEIVPVKADKRPMIQVYVPGQSVIGCFLSGMWWEQECEAESNETKLVNDFYFTLNKRQRILEITQTGTPTLPDFAMGTPGSGAYYTITAGGFSFSARYDETTDPENPFNVWEITRISDGVTLFRYKSYAVEPNVPYSVTLAAVEGSGATGSVTLYVHDMAVYARYVTDVETAEIGGQIKMAHRIPDNDIVENNRNYNYVIGYEFPDCILFSSLLVETPTKWGIYQPGQYYYNPADVPSLGIGEAFPVARSAWGRISIWFTFSLLDPLIEPYWRKGFTLKDAYPIWSVISVLLGQIAPGITHAATTDYSQFLYGTNLIGITQTLLITPKSNIISSGYDQPAQKAPITLKNVLDMLRDCFRCYWFVDDQNRFRVEHIQYFRNGGSYSGSPVVGIDLTAQKVTRNGKAWSFARDQFKFDKPEMAARYQFGWMDDVTQLFEGFPIDIISKYVNPDNIEQIEVSKFTSDIDYVLLNPSEISKDGFVLLSAEHISAESELVYNLDSYTKRNYNIVQSTGLYGTNTTYKHIIIPVTPGRTIRVVPSENATDARIAWFTSNATPTSGGTPPYVPGTSLIVLTQQADLLVPNGANYMFIYFGNSPYNYKPQSVVSLSEPEKYELPYLNYIVGTNDHYLQNAYVAFCILQSYYAYDMPARLYAINSVQMSAQGVKRLKTQSLKFPLLTDPNLVQLVKTNLGNGMIEKLSVNLSSRNANATLHYDTE